MDHQRQFVELVPSLIEVENALFKAHLLRTGLVAQSTRILPVKQRIRSPEPNYKPSCHCAISHRVLVPPTLLPERYDPFKEWHCKSCNPLLAASRSPEGPSQ